MQTDQLIISNMSSCDDFDASLKQRRIGAPKKKVIKETVPFSNITHDFSAINGEVYWEERNLEYVFEIIANNPQELEYKKNDFSAWMMNVMQEELHDPYIPDWHFLATYDDMEYDDDESLEKTTVTVKFTAYPYKIENALTAYSIAVPANSQVMYTVVNDSSHRITPTFVSAVSVTVERGDISYTVPAGEVTDDKFKLEVGANVLTVINHGNADCILNIKYHNEVF